jgi:hypothetical protein
MWMCILNYSYVHFVVYIQAREADEDPFYSYVHIGGGKGPFRRTLLFFF